MNKHPGTDWYSKKIEKEFDAYHTKVRRLMDALKFYMDEDECKYGPSEGGGHPYCSNDECCRWCNAMQAIAEVERANRVLTATRGA